ncbi:methyltransferase-like protein [Selaginella moellendorffii]|uniref:methyltransferase-like protein n=1 Tax=Selaginella moellendorffii TaxID=88036 RepID=UPI000D1CC83B|nr:methyltransferase-like protein [Selaginella moellendorffii]|eukprot:XP_024539956.1 methyltransferase-like protein [Selaginella moellendorffii]
MAANLGAKLPTARPLKGIPCDLARVEDEVISSEHACTAALAWEKFHSRHSQGFFFKERRYLLKEFPELGRSNQDFTVLEVGCGAGSSAIEALPTWLACDACRASDFGIKSSLVSCCEGGADFITLIFALSALADLDQMSNLLKECCSVLRPGGMLLFRDYGLYDMTMLRFPADQKVAANCYRRLDGTLSYFFSCEAVRDLFTGAGLLEVELEYCCIKLVNHKTKVPMKRVWVHAKFMKPDHTK